MAGELVIVGTLQSLEQKPGSEWMRYVIAVPGKQYPYKADTRDADVIQAAQAVGTALSTWTINEVEAKDADGNPKINPRNSKPYMNRYLQKVEAGGTAAANGSGPSSGGKEDVDWDAKERRDYRSRSWAHTFSAFSHTIKTDEDPMLVFARLKPFQTAVYEDIVRDLMETATTAENTGDATPSEPHPDDDIPF